MDDLACDDVVLSAEEAAEVEAELEAELEEELLRFSEPRTRRDGPSSLLPDDHGDSDDCALDGVEAELTVGGGGLSRGPSEDGDGQGDEGDEEASSPTSLSDLPGFEAFRRASLDAVATCGALSTSIREAGRISISDDTAAVDGEDGCGGPCPVDTEQGGGREGPSLEGPSFEAPAEEVRCDWHLPSNSDAGESAIGMTVRGAVDQCVTRCESNAAFLANQERDASLRNTAMSDHPGGAQSNSHQQQCTVVTTVHEQLPATAGSTRDTLMFETFDDVLDAYRIEVENDAREAARRIEVDQHRLWETRRNDLRRQHQEQSLMLRAARFLQSRARLKTVRRRRLAETARERRNAQSNALACIERLVVKYLHRWCLSNWRCFAIQKQEEEHWIEHIERIENMGRNAEQKHLPSVQMQCFMRSSMSRQRHRELESERKSLRLFDACARQIQSRFRRYWSCLTCRELNKAPRMEENERVVIAAVLLVQRYFRSRLLRSALRNGRLKPKVEDLTQGKVEKRDVGLSQHSGSYRAAIICQCKWRSHVAYRTSRKKRMEGSQRRKAQDELHPARQLAGERFRGDESLRRKVDEQRRMQELERIKRSEAAGNPRVAEKAAADIVASANRERARAAHCVDGCLFGNKGTKPTNGRFRDIASEHARRCRYSLDKLHAWWNARDVNREPEGSNVGERSSDTALSVCSARCLGQGVRGIERHMLEGYPQNVEKLDLSMEGIEDASGLVRLGMTSLISLSLDVNNISPDLRCFAGLSCLKRLSLRDNCLVSLRGVEHLAIIEFLDVETNRLQSLFPLGELKSIGSLPYLTNLNVGTNQITTLSGFPGGGLTSSLQVVNLYQNRLSQLPSNFLQGMGSLIALNLGRNHIRDSRSIGSSLSAAPTLRSVVLSQNRLKSLPVPLVLPFLDELWLSGNNINTTTCWSKDNRVWLPCLSDLHLQENCLEELDPCSFAVAAPNLQRLDLSFNELSCVQNICDALKYISHLEKLNVLDNPVSSSHSEQEALIRASPNLKVLNGASVSPDSRWVIRADMHSSCSVTVVPALSSFVLEGSNVPMNRGCNGATESWRKRSLNHACSFCGFARRSGVIDIGERAGIAFECPRCSTPLLPVPPLSPPVAWHAFSALSDPATRTSKSNRLASYLALSRNHAQQALCIRRAQRKAKISSLAASGGDADTDRVGISEAQEWTRVTETQLKATLSQAGENENLKFVVWHKPYDEWCNGKHYHYRAAQKKLLLREQAAIRMQSFIRMFLAQSIATGRMDAIMKQRALLVIQKILRGCLVRSRIKSFKGKTFQYVDEELDALFNDETGLNIASGFSSDDEDFLSLTAVEPRAQINLVKPTRVPNFISPQETNCLNRLKQGKGAPGLANRTVTNGHMSGQAIYQTNRGREQPIFPQGFASKEVCSSSDLDSPISKQRLAPKMSKRQEDIMKDWGFTDTRVVKTMLCRRRRLARIKQRNIKSRTSADPSQSRNFP